MLFEEPNIRRHERQRSEKEKTMKTNSETYSVVVRNPNSWNAATGVHEVLAHCGHNHKTYSTAQKCYDKLTRSYCNHGHIAGTPCKQCLGYAQANSTSARWYHAEIETNWTAAQLEKMAAEKAAQRKADDEYYERKVISERAGILVSDQTYKNADDAALAFELGVRPMYAHEKEQLAKEKKITLRGKDGNFHTLRVASEAPKSFTDFDGQRRGEEELIAHGGARCSQCGKEDYEQNMNDVDGKTLCDDCAEDDSPATYERGM